MMKVLSCVFSAGTWAIVSAYNSPGRVSSPHVHYEMPRVECEANLLQSSGTPGSFGSLAVYGDGVECVNSLGVLSQANPAGSFRLQSQGDAAAFYELLQTSDSEGFSLEMWLHHDDTVLDKAGAYTLMASSNRTSLTSSSPEECASQELDFEMYVRNGTYGLRTSSVGGDCQDVQVADYNLVSGQYVHLLWVVQRLAPVELGMLAVTAYVNGLELVRTLWRVPDFGQEGFWRDDYVLNIMSRGRSSSDSDDPQVSSRALPGTVFMAAVYARPLLAGEVEQNYAAGLPNSRPVPLDASVVLNEDGESGDHYSTPSFYLQPVPFGDLSNFSVSVVDADEDPAFPGYTANAAAPELWVASLPTRGQLLDSSGYSISSVPHKLQAEVGNSSTNTFSLMYRPEKDESSGETQAYASFRCFAVDGVTGLRSTSNNTVAIHVLAKNDPPTAINSNATVFGNRASIISFTGYDIDEGDYVSSVRLVTPPSRGELYQVHEDGSVSSDVLEAGDLLWTLEAAYVYTAGASSTSEQGLLDTDSLAFTALDVSGAESLLGVIDITAYSSVVATIASDIPGDTSWKVSEDQASLVNLYAVDLSDEALDIQFVISSTPSCGTLRDPSTQRALAVGDALLENAESPYASAVQVIYEPSQDFFSVPNVAWDGSQLANATDDSFSFFAAVAGNAAYRSVEVTQGLEVGNVNDAVHLACPTGPFTVSPLGSSGTTSVSSAGSLDEVAIQGFELVDQDRGVDVSRFRISSHYGLLTLIHGVESLDFNSNDFCFRQSSWACEGSGTNDQDMTFVAVPEDALVALNSLRYQSQNPSVEDVVTVLVFDGANGECIDEEFLSPDTTRSECWAVECSFNVSVEAMPIADVNAGTNGTRIDDPVTAGVEQLFGTSLPLLAWVAVGACTIVLSLCITAFCIFFVRTARVCKGTKDTRVAEHSVEESAGGGLDGSGTFSPFANPQRFLQDGTKQVADR